MIYYLQSFLEILKNISIGTTDLVVGLYILTMNNAWIKADLDFSPIPTFPLCNTLDLIKHIKNGTNTPSNVFIDFNKKEGFGVTLFLGERIKKVNRALKSSLDSYTGNEMETGL